MTVLKNAMLLLMQHTIELLLLTWQEEYNTLNKYGM